MSRARLALTAGILLLVTSCLLPCVPLAEVSGGSMPYQDAPPELLTKQAAEVAAAEHRLVVAAAVAGALFVVALLAFWYAWRHRRPRTLLSR